MPATRSHEVGRLEPQSCVQSLNISPHVWRVLGQSFMLIISFAISMERCVLCERVSFSLLTSMVHELC
jgi:hypothetical protein